MKIVVDPSQIKIDPNEIHSLLGVPGGEVDQHTMQLIDTTIRECREVMSPRGGVVSVDATPSASGEEIAIEGARFHTGKIIRNMLKGADAYLFFISTAGPGPEELSRSLLNKGDYLEGYIADLVGSAIAESVAGQIHEHVRREAVSRELKVTNRYSPGYCAWETGEQQKLFSLFPDGCCGVTLSESSLMVPVKSVSGVIAMGRSVQYREYTCEICAMKDCTFRQYGAHHHSTI